VSQVKSLPIAKKESRRSLATRSAAPPATRRAQKRLGLILVAPLMLMVGVFILFPVANAVYYSLTDFDGLNPTPPFVGLDNFVELAQDPNVWPAFKNTVIWIVLGTVGPLVFGLALAMAVWTVKNATIFYRIAIFLPYVLPQVAIGVVWTWIYDTRRGWLNEVLEFLGLGAFTTGWLGNPDTALYAVLGTAVWATTGFVFVILLAALRNVDTELVDASRIDGANALQRLWYIILPQIMPVFLMVTTITLVGGFAVFDIVFIMTGGGPAGASEVLGTYAYSSAFELSRISYGTALALVITVLSVPIAIALNRLQRRVSLQGTGA
jgi:ABC-type sugar transport system permease subunit